MTFESLHQQTNCILLKCISGSNAYGLALPHSDIDIKGIFISPKDEYYGLEYTEQVANASNDEVYYELRRFFNLLLKNNPNILELLASLLKFSFFLFTMCSLFRFSRSIP